MASGATSLHTPPASPKGYPFDDSSVKFKPLDKAYEEKQEMWANIALSILALSITGAVVLGITACAVSIPLTPLLVTIGVIFVSAVSSVVLYSKSTPDPEPTPLDARHSASSFDSAFSAFIGREPEKKFIILGKTAPPARALELATPIQNPSCNCFMNAAMQLVFQDAEISRYLMQVLDTIAKDETFSGINPALEFVALTPEGVHLNESSQYPTLELLQAALAKAKQDHAALDEVAFIKKHKLQIEIEELSAKADKEEELALKIAELEALVVEASPEMLTQLASYMALGDKIKELTRKQENWEQGNLFIESIGDAIAAFKAENQTDVDIERVNLRLQNLYPSQGANQAEVRRLHKRHEMIFYSLSLKQAASYAHSILNDWRSERTPITQSDGILLRICLLKLLGNKTKVKPSDKPKTQALKSVEELLSHTYPGTKQQRFERLDSKGDIILFEISKTGERLKAHFLKKSGEHTFTFNQETIFSTKEQAAAAADCLNALAASESPKTKFFQPNIHGDQLKINYGSMDCSSLFLRELMGSLHKLRPEVECPFSYTYFSQTKRDTYDDEQVPNGDPKPAHQSYLFERLESVVDCVMPIGAGEVLFDAQKAFSNQFETVITAKDAVERRHRPAKSDAVHYRNSGKNYKPGIDEGREFKTTTYKWALLPRKLLIGLDHGHTVQGPAGVVNQTIEKKLFKFSDNKRLIIDINDTGHTPEGETQKAGNYMLTGFTVNRDQIHYVHYSRHFEIPGNFETSYWVQTNDGHVSVVSTDEIVNILFNKAGSYKNHLANTLIFEKMEPLAPPALEDGGRDAESDAEEGSPRASAKVRAAAALFEEVD